MELNHHENLSIQLKRQLNLDLKLLGQIIDTDITDDVVAAINARCNVIQTLAMINQQEEKNFGPVSDFNMPSLQIF